MAKTFDALVIGAGIIGAACTRELAAGGLRVALCEASDYAGGGATAAGMGHLAVMDDSEAQFALTAYSQQLWRELAPQLPKSAEYMDCGSLWVAGDAEEFAEVERKFAFYSRRNIPVEKLDAKQLAEAEPNLRAGLAGALLMPSDSVCYPPCAARYMVEQAVLAGCELMFNCRVDSISGDGVWLADGSHIGAGIVLVAGGTASIRLVPDLEMYPRKGHLIITDRYPGFLRHQLIELGYLKSAHSLESDSVAFNAQPRQTGQILIGSSRQYGIEDPAIEDQMLNRMLARAIEYMPAIENLFTIRGWTGFRAATPDKLPVIGLAPSLRNVYLATGHEGLGISTSLATARLLADQILRRPSAIPVEPYSPSRNFVAYA